MLYAPFVGQGIPGFRNLEFVQSAAVPSNDDLLGIAVSPDGTKMMVGLDPSNGDIQNFSMSTPFDVSTLSLTSQRSGPGDFPYASDFNDDGTEFVIDDPQGDYLNIYSTSGTPYEYDTSFVERASHSSLGADTNVVILKWTRGGTKAIYSNADKFGIITAATPYRLSGRTQSGLSLPPGFPTTLTSFGLIENSGQTFLVLSSQFSPSTLFLVRADKALDAEDPDLLEIIDTIELPSLGVFEWLQVGAPIDGRKLLLVNNNGTIYEFNWLGPQR